jgi:hypothetical protein
VTSNARQTPLSRPSSIAIHNDRNVVRHICARRSTVDTGATHIVPIVIDVKVLRYQRETDK